MIEKQKKEEKMAVPSSYERDKGQNAIGQFNWNKFAGEATV